MSKDPKSEEWKKVIESLEEIGISGILCTPDMSIEQIEAMVEKKNSRDRCDN